MLTPTQLARIKILQAIEKNKKSQTKYVKQERRYIDSKSLHIPTKRGFQEAIVNHIKNQK